jgi:hypothetical protein
MAAIRLEPLQSEDLLRLGQCGWRATACGELAVLVRTGPGGRVAAIPIGEEGPMARGSEGKAGPLLRFADALVALSRSELIRLLLRQAACAALMRLNPLADCSRMEWALERSDGTLVPLAPPSEIAPVRQEWEAYLEPLKPLQLPKFLLASQAADLQRPDWLRGLLRGEGIEVASAREFATAKIRCPSAEPVLERLAELERKAAGLLERHAEAVREMLGKMPALSDLCSDPISAQGVLAVCLVGDGFRIACAVAEKLPARDPLEAWGGTGGEEERVAQTPGRAGLRRMPMSWA